MALAFLLALSLADAPRLAFLALGLEEPECQGECAHGLDTDSCPPGCTTGRCAKLPAAVTEVVAALRELPPASTAGLAPVLAPPRGPGGKRLFHPPRG